MTVISFQQGSIGNIAAQLPAQNGAVDGGKVARDTYLEHVRVTARLALIAGDGPMRTFAWPAGVAVGDKHAGSK